MANYSVTDYTIQDGNLATVVAALETKLETIDTTKTIRMMAIYATPDLQYMGVMIYDA